MNKSLITTAVATAAAAPGAFGELVKSEVFLELLPSEAVYIDLDENSWSTSTGIGGEFQISGNVGFSAGDHGKAEVTALGASGVEFFISETDQTARRFSYGDALIGGTRSNASTENYNTGLGEWGGFTGVGFLGFKQGENVGWLELDYNPGTDQNGSIELRRFAYANAGEVITAGQAAVPEPATTAAVMALAAGSAVLYARRRRSA